MPQYHSNQAMYVSTGDPETVSDSAAKLFAPGQLGRFLTIKRPGPAGTAAGSNEDYRDHTYRYVQCDSTMTTTPFPGAVAWWSDKSRFKVSTLPTATDREHTAGIFKSTPTNLSDYVYIQTGGPSSVKFVDAPAAAIAIGQSVIPSATAGKADTIAIGGTQTYTRLGTVAAPLQYNAASQVAVVDLFVPEIP